MNYRISHNLSVKQTWRILFHTMILQILKIKLIKSKLNRISICNLHGTYNRIVTIELF